MMRHDASLQVIDVGVDYLTCTAPRDHRGEALNEMADSIMRDQISQGFEQRLWKWKSYHGKGAGGVQVGLRYDGYIVRLSSTAAASHCKQFIRAASNVSRVDLQVTCYDQSHHEERAFEAYYQVDEAPRRGGRPPTADLRMNKGGGQTCYIGARTSDVVGRLYDKGIESKIAPRGQCWRFEVEYKRKLAKSVSHSLLEEQTSPASIARTVMDYFSDRGVPGALSGEESAPLNLAADRGIRLNPLTDRERKLRWLQTAVAPTVAFLVGCGGRQQVLDVLGLGERRHGVALSPDPSPSFDETSEGSYGKDR